MKTRSALASKFASSPSSFTLCAAQAYAAYTRRVQSCARPLRVAAPSSSRRPKSHRRRRERILGRHLQLSCRRRCRRCSPSRHLLPVSMSVPKASNLFTLLASLKETASQVLEAPRRSHHHQPVSTSGSKARVQTAQLVTFGTASNPHEAPACMLGSQCCPNKHSKVIGGGPRGV